MDRPLQLNLTEIIKNRAGKKAKWIPRPLLRCLERVIRQEQLNEMLRVAHPRTGSEFSKAILQHLTITLDVKGLDALPSDEAFIFASNHPLGGLDGISLVGILGSHYGDENVRVLVNDLLMNVTPLAGVFLPTNKFGKKGARESSLLLNKALEEGKQIVMFPAGLVSRLHAGGVVKDLEWKKTFVSKALEFGRRIVPVRFEGENSRKFYLTAKRRKNLGLKVNIEQALLPSEVCKSEGKHFTVTFLEPVDPQEMKNAGLKPADIAREIYNRIFP